MRAWSLCHFVTMATAEFKKRQQHSPEGLEDYCFGKISQSNITIMNHWSEKETSVSNSSKSVSRSSVANASKTAFETLHTVTRTQLKNNHATHLH